MTGAARSAKCTGVDDLSQRSLRELLTLARERLGRAAANLKTRDELLAALQAFDAPRQASRPAAPTPPKAPTPPGPSTPQGASTSPPVEAPRVVGEAAPKPTPDLARSPAPGAAAGARVRDAAPLRAPPPVHPAPPAHGAAAELPPAVVTRDFFIARH